MGKIKLNIDFDGVILDTIPLLYEMLKTEGIPREDFERARSFFASLNWEKFIGEAKELNNSLKNIQDLYQSGLFSIYILTHVNSIKEMVVKTKFIRSHFDRIPIISVPKELPKPMVLGESVEGAILVDDYAGNLRVWEQAGGVGIKYTDEVETREFVIVQSLDQIPEVVQREAVQRRLRRGM